MTVKAHIWLNLSALST